MDERHEGKKEIISASQSKEKEEPKDIGQSKEQIMELAWKTKKMKKK